MGQLQKIFAAVLSVIVGIGLFFFATIGVVIALIVVLILFIVLWIGPGRGKFGRVVVITNKPQGNNPHDALTKETKSAQNPVYDLTPDEYKSHDKTSDTRE